MKWYDYFLPTTYVGAIIFGLVLTLIFAFLNKKETGSWQKFVVTWIGGFASTLIAAYLLYRFGYFD